MKYFQGARSNPGWELLESEEARRFRGHHGSRRFRRLIIQERGYKCERCGAQGLSPEERKGLSRPERQRRELHIHHVIKVVKARHLRFERENVVLCCQPCHVILERVSLFCSMPEEAA